MTRHLLFMLTASGAVAAAQWLNYPTPGIPSLADGQADRPPEFEACPPVNDVSLTLF